MPGSFTTLQKRQQWPEKPIERAGRGQVRFGNGTCKATTRGCLAKNSTHRVNELAGLIASTTYESGLRCGFWDLVQPRGVGPSFEVAAFITIAMKRTITGGECACPRARARPLHFRNGILCRQSGAREPTSAATWKLPLPTSSDASYFLLGPLRCLSSMPRTVMRFSCQTSDGAYRQPCTLVPVHVASSVRTRGKCESLRLIVGCALLH